MNEELLEIKCDLLVIGAGLAGMAAALFAAGRGLDTVQAGMRGGLDFASGLLDLMAVHPVDEGRVWLNPWQAIEALVKDCPRHPYARLQPGEILSAINEFTAFLGQNGHPYVMNPDRNVMVPTLIGTLKPTLAVPLTMAGGVKAFEEKAPCLIIDFHGLKGFSGAQIKETLTKAWLGLRTERIRFPGEAVELFPEFMALALELPEKRALLADAIRPHLDGVEYIGLPAILGIYKTGEIFQDLRDQLGKALFEIPTMLPAVAGLRLREAFEQNLPRAGVRAFYREKVLAAESVRGGGFRFEVGHDRVRTVVQARGAVLATGRFMGEGLDDDGGHIRETVFNLPVSQPANRDNWHHKVFPYIKSHQVNHSGVATDELFRPLGPGGKVAYLHLFAAGSILAHQDWTRQKCGSGLSIASAYAAVTNFIAGG